MTTTDRIAAVIRNFPFWDYGMPEINPNDRCAEWVPDLAKRIADEVTVTATTEADLLVDLVHEARNNGIYEDDDDWEPIDELLRRLRPDKPFREEVTQ